jgi:hypothetical protein
MLCRGEVRNHDDIARLGYISRERMGQVLVFAWLAPDIQQEVLSLSPQARRRITGAGHRLTVECASC